MLEVVAGLIREGDRILICRRPEGKARAGCWEFPGGKVEAGETLSQALARELKEELGAGFRAGSPAGDTVFAYPDIAIHLTLLEAFLEEGTPQALEHSEIRYVHPEDFPEYRFCPADQRLLGQLAAKKRADGEMPG